MVNATQMAKPFGKQPRDFMKADHAQRFTEVLAAKLNVLPTDLVRIVNGGKGYGTWMHQKLALKFASWLNPEFELCVYVKFYAHPLGGTLSTGGLQASPDW
jgi:hypothetical protein